MCVCVCVFVFVCVCMHTCILNVINSLRPHTGAAVAYSASRAQEGGFKLSVGRCVCVWRERAGRGI